DLFGFALRLGEQDELWGGHVAVVPARGDLLPLELVLRAELEREAEARDVVPALRAVPDRELVALRAVPVLFRAVDAFFAPPRPGSFCCRPSRSFKTDLLWPRRVLRASLSCLSTSLRMPDPPLLISPRRSFSASCAESTDLVRRSSAVCPLPRFAVLARRVVDPERFGAVVLALGLMGLLFDGGLSKPMVLRVASHPS